MSATTAALDLRELASGAPRANWIVSPVIDLLFCCGGNVGIFVLVHRLALEGGSGHVLQAMFLLTALATHLFSNSHTAATLVRLFRERGDAQLSRFTTWLPLGFASIGVVALFIDGLASVLFKVYMLWVVQHYTSQTYGIALIYCYKRGYRFDPGEQRVLRGLMYATAAFGIARQLAWPRWGSQEMLGIRVPFWKVLPPWAADLALVVLLAFGTAFAIVVVRRATRRGELLPLPAFAVIATGIAIFTAEWTLSHTLWLYVPALYHGSQYLAISGTFYMKDQSPSRTRSALRLVPTTTNGRAMTYFCMVFAGGLFLYFGIPHLLGSAGFPYATAAVSFFAVINFHHFMADSAIWRLRDSRIRRILAG